MGQVRWKDESKDMSLEEVLTEYSWYKAASSRPDDPNKKKGSLLLGNPAKYSPLARGFIKREKCVPPRRGAPKSVTSTRNAAANRPRPKGDVDVKSEHKSGEGTWLHKKIKQFFDEPPKHRLGELPTALVKALWGKTVESADDKKASDSTADDLIRKLTKLKKKEERPAECLMDVLLRSWTYFNHSHSKPKTAGNHIHAKYCENAFDHFLLPDGTQVHGSYTVPVQKLITELRSLLVRLKARVVHTDYKVLPTWRPPNLEEVAEFALPPFKEIPPLYPIKGLLKASTEDVPANITLPLFSPPTPKPHPPLVIPDLIKAPMLSLPTMREFSIERKSIDYSLEEDLPLPTFVPPEPSPLPVWQEPEQQPLPPEPQLKEIEVLSIPILEPVPPYLAPVPQPRPCEASYYPVSDAASSLCDGLCGNIKNPLTGKAWRCLVKPPAETLPEAPLPPSFQMRQEPLFLTPPEELIPEFKPPPLIPEPKYVAPSKPLFPEWSTPPAPEPIGYLAGQRPVFLIECSSTMAGERMNVAKEAIRCLFAKGGQVDIAATDFDIIMYSFEAWSFGAFEEERLYKVSGGPMRHWVKNVEVMQPKTLTNVDKALTWMGKWQTGGRSNLVNALEVAFQRQTADCIYLLTDGKPERPVILMNMLKKLAKERGKITPVYPIGIGPNKRGSWFMQKIAEITGGKYRELDLQWRSKVTAPVQGTEPLQRAIEEEQRRNLEAGIREDIENVLEKVKHKFQEEKYGPRYTEYLEEEKTAKENHRRASDMIGEQNAKALADAMRLHEKLSASIQERNKEKYEQARKDWVEELQTVKALNLQRKKLQADWERSISEIESARAKSVVDAKKAFLDDVKAVEQKNAYQEEQSKKLHDLEVKQIKEKNEKLKSETEARQAEIAAQTDAHNRELRREYQSNCSQIRALNASVLARARADFSAACTAINSENQLKLEEAKQEFSQVCEEVEKENLRRRNEYRTKVAELDLRMQAAVVAHQQQVSAVIADHDTSLAKISAINATLESEAKRDWEERCKLIDEENERVRDKAVRDWEAACRAVQEENERRDRRRLELFEQAAEIDHLNQEIVKKKKEEWNETCARLEQQYQEEVELARKEHENYVNDVERRNEETVEASKVAYSAQLAAVETYNETIRPYVESSKLVQKEIDRINLFLHHIVDKLEMPTLKKSPFSSKGAVEQGLDVLSGKEQPCHPKILCEALRAAYADDVNSGTFPEKPPASTRSKPDAATPTKPRSKFEGMVPISPTRLSGYHHDMNRRKRTEVRGREFLKKTVTRRQHEIAALISPMVVARG